MGFISNIKKASKTRPAQCTNSISATHRSSWINSLLGYYRCLIQPQPKLPEFSRGYQQWAEDASMTLSLSPSKTYSISPRAAPSIDSIGPGYFFSHHAPHSHTTHIPSFIFHSRKKTFADPPPPHHRPCKRYILKSLYIRLTLTVCILNVPFSRSGIWVRNRRIHRLHDNKPGTRLRQGSGAQRAHARPRC